MSRNPAMSAFRSLLPPAVLLAAALASVGDLPAAPPVASDEQAQQTAKEVLSAQDFWWKRTSQVETPSFFGRIFAAIYDYLIKPVLDWAYDLLKTILKAILEWFMSGVASVAGDWSGGIPFLRLLMIALIAFVVWRLIVFVLKRQPVAPVVSRAQAPERIATSVELLADAEAASARGDQKEAIRLAFLAVIAHFQDQGKLSGSRSRSNREYLRELHPWPDLSDIFRRCAEPFERCWYGGRRLDGLEVDNVISECRRLATAGGA